MTTSTDSEKSLQKKLYLRYSAAATLVLLNSIYAGVTTYCGESLEYPILFQLLHILYWLQMLPSVLLIIFYKNIRLELTAWALALYMINLLIYLGTLHVL
ncbi:MAG: hypothetical protein E7052_01225 [Lentisphaerae bacterium]|nr:hypothetical protein [Lentisphaerota bacterium]